MTQIVLDEYREFVELKAALPRPLLDFNQFRLLHGALGLSTEILELVQSRSRENTLEEVGDLFWYITYCSNCLRISTDTLLELYDPNTRLNPNTLQQDLLVSHLEDFISEIKKHIIYDTPRSLLEPFLCVVKAFYNYLVAIQYPLEDLIEHNTSKLNKRYSKQFTPEESSSRKDKQEEGTQVNKELA